MFGLIRDFTNLFLEPKDGFYTDTGPYTVPHFAGTDDTESGHNLAACGREFCSPGEDFSADLYSAWESEA